MAHTVIRALRRGIRTVGRELAAWRSHVDLLVQWAIYRVVSLFSGVLDRDETVWVFGARGGNEFCDNAKYLFLWVAANDPDIRPVWLTHSDAVVRQLQDNGYEAYRAFSLRGIVLSLRAGVVCVTQGLRDVNMGCVAGATLVQLWHGIPLKTIAWDAEWPTQPWLVQRCHREMADEIDLVTTPSAAAIEPLSSGLGVDADRFVVTGYPRNDALVSSIEGAHIGAEKAARESIRSASRHSRIILYLPTYRETGESFVDQLDFEMLNAQLVEDGAQLYIKAHPAEPVENTDCAQSNIHWLPAAVEPYAVLPDADVLVTDYSSVYFDFLQLDRPIVFFPYDLAAYTDTRGLYFEYESVTPGPTVTDCAELRTALSEAVAAADGETDPYAADRRRLRGRFCPIPVGTASATVYRALVSQCATLTVTSVDSPAIDAPVLGTELPVSATRQTRSDRTV